MSRQRTINDQRFWRNPSLVTCTTEDKAALFHLLTCPDSNVIGAYALIPRIAGAEIGWTPEQWLQVIDRLKAADLAWYDAGQMFVWVRIWWEHHNASQVMGPKLRKSTMENIRCLPEPWRQAFLQDFRVRLSNEHQALLDSALKGDTMEDTLSIPYPYPIDESSNLSCYNNNANSNANASLTTTPTASLGQPLDFSGIPEEHRQAVQKALHQSQQSGTAKAQPQAVIDELARQYKSDKPPRSPAALTHYLAQNLDVTGISDRSMRATPAEMAALEGRCYAWPSANPTKFASIRANGEYDQFSTENGRMIHRIGRLGQGALLAAIREGSLREIPATLLPKIANE